MLGSIRDKATGWIAGVIVGALIISFALWGVGSYFGQSGQINIVKVNETMIDGQTYQRAYTNLRRQMQAMFGDEMSLEEDEFLRQQTLQRLIETEVLNQLVMQQNLRVSDSQVANTIRNLEVFQGENGFDRFKYETGIANLGLNPTMFENELRKDLLAEQLQAGLAETVFVTEPELNQVLTLENQTRDITYTILNIDDQLNDILVNDSEIEDYYEANKNNYQEPEQVRIAYIDLDVEKIAETIEFTEDDLKAYYQNNKDTYDVTEQRSVTKLFVKIEEDADEEARTNARVVMDRVLEMANSGEEFEKIIESFTEEGKGALEFSEHPFMTKGVMGDEIDAFLFSANEGDTSGIIESDKGLNIVKVGEIRGGPKNVFDRVAEQVEYDYKVNQAELQYFEMADQLTTLAYEHPDSLDIAAESIAVPVQESDFFNRTNNNEDITSNDRLIAASFNQELIDSGINSDAIELGENHIAVIRVLEYKPAAIKAMADVRDDVIADIKQKRAADVLKDLGEHIISQLKDGLEPEAVETDIDVNWKTEEGVKRDAVTVNRSVLRTAFQLTPIDENPAISSYQLGSGDYAVIMVTAVHEGMLDNVADEESGRTDLKLRRIKSSAEWKEFLGNTRENAEITIFEENI